MVILGMPKGFSAISAISGRNTGGKKCWGQGKRVCGCGGKERKARDKN